MSDLRTCYVGDGCAPDGHRSDPTLADLRVGDVAGSPVVGRLRAHLAYGHLEGSDYDAIEAVLDELVLLREVAEAASEVRLPLCPVTPERTGEGTCPACRLRAALARLEETR